MTLKGFLHAKVEFNSEKGTFTTYDRSTYIEDEHRERQFANLNCLKSLKYLFRKMDNCNLGEVYALREKLGEFIADAINEKIERDFK